MDTSYLNPVYTISIVAGMLKVCQATLRIWEKKGLIKPSRIGKNRFYSRFDVERLKQIKDLLQKKGVNIQGVKRIIGTTRCWEIKKCNIREREVCKVYLTYK